MGFACESNVGMGRADEDEDEDDAMSLGVTMKFGDRSDFEAETTETRCLLAKNAASIQKLTSRLEDASRFHVIFRVLTPSWRQIPLLTLLPCPLSICFGTLSTYVSY